ncbi:MAG: Gfo/Idh/MocA family oxidoreductase [Acidimicrobiia bacterium]|nr:Gfo/Idh/MocA family oxidoreductase [Acidimicrobiia bacterium]MYB75028.1 Gfo/Idh/MocA family oxidoreductase [Acidimicrobiia bacterium]MYH99951.1 Gfo/Idh/MocA family oxidoreductase [Acidimicrobiia bacterium]
MVAEADDIRFGMVGHGHISGQFLSAMEVVEGAHIDAVAGRDSGRASAFAQDRGIAASYGSVGEMLDAEQLDAVYICTPHPSHVEAALACVDAGVAVLVEKPLAPNLEGATRIVDAARDAGVFAMEAMWTRFLPIYEVVRRWVDDGRIGDVQLVTAAFGFAAPVMPEHRLFNPDLAGGSLLDVGVYPLTIAHWLYGSHPSEYGVVGRVGETGVDEIVSIAASYPGGGLAQLGCATVANLDFSAMIYGTAGSIEIPVFFAADRAILRAGGEEEVEEIPHRANGFEYEIQEVVDGVRAGRTESERMPLSLTLEMAGLCDEIRGKLGVVYPFEKGGS